MLNPKLKELTARIHDKKLQKKVTEFLRNPTFELNGKVYSGVPLEVSPGGLAHHHTYRGGYLEHVVSTAKLALVLCDIVEEVYGGRVDRDLVMAGVLLHDIFKPVTYTIDDKGVFASSDVAEYLDHVSLATSELVRRDFPLNLVHMVTAHYGSYGPMKPRTIEALILHLADNADSQLNGQVLNAAGWMTRKVTGEYMPNLTSKEAFEIVRSKATEGWQGVEKAVEKISQARATQKT
ncbi:MAG: HD domain-containing protein [Candidatus Bathyarchaeia archaeon]